MKFYHSTTPGAVESILRDGLKVGMFGIAKRMTDTGMVSAGDWADEYYGDRPIYLAVRPEYYNKAPRQLGLELEVEIDDPRKLIADLPSLGDTGAYLEVDGLGWEHVPPGMASVANDGYVGFDQLLRPGSPAAMAAIRTTGTAAMPEDIPAEKITRLGLLENRRRFAEDAESRERFSKAVEELPPDVPRRIIGQPGESKEKSYQKMAKMGRNLKQIFAKEADRSFIDSLTTVHWGNKKDILDILLDYKSLRRDELSTAAHLSPGEIGQKGPWGFDYGLVVKGYITLLANDMDDLGTGSGKKYKAYLPAQRTQSSGVNKGAMRIYYQGEYRDYQIIVLDKEDWKPRVVNGINHNEALVDNWKIEAVIVPRGQQAAIEIARFEKYLAKVGIDAFVGVPLTVGQKLGSVSESLLRRYVRHTINGEEQL